MKNSIKDALNNKYRTLRMMQRVCSTKQEPVIDMCVNLRIVERESVQQNESDFVKANEYSSRTQQIVDFDKLSPIKFTHCADINIEQIFDNVKTTKVAIYGRAGIGKSTLCQYISVKWQEGNLWSDKFNAVFWLPLRDIVGYQSEEEEVQRYLADIVRNRCIAGFDTEKPTVLNIAEYIFAPENAGKILVILDGYDEVAHSMPKKLQDLLRMILESERFCSILTSRPVAITLSNKAVTFDQELENVGFAQKNIKTYIKKFYPKDSKKLRDLIESNSSLRNIAYIPLNLELICSVWASSPNLQQNCTLTQLYQEVIELMGKRMYEKPVFASNTERKAVVLELLSEIALLGMTERKSILDPKKVQAIINKKENELNIQNLFEEVLAFGVLKIAMINKDLRENPLSFIHHTFQEHFASLNMVKAFEQYHVDEVDHESLAMLKSVKYDPYYEKMLISVVGLLYANCNISGNYLPLFYFWDIFENEPRELLGNKHDTLKALLQNECPTITNPPAALSKLNSSLINLERMLDNIFHTIENGANLEKCNAIEVLINLNITDQDLLESVATRLEKLVLKYSVKIQDMKIDENDLIKLTVYLAYGLLSLGANSKAALDILCKSYYYCTTGMRAPKIGDSPKREYNKDYALYQAEALQRLRANNNVNTEIKRKLEKRLIQHQSKRIELIGWFGQNDDNSSNIVGISYMAGLVGGLVVINPATPFALLMVGGVTIASGMSARCITQSSLYQYYFQSTRNLDTIYKSSDADRLKLICEKVNNSERIVLRWAREGMLDLLSAIQLYSYSKQSIWLAPMKNIVFLYKDPSLIFTIQNKLIKNSNTTLTSTAHQTQAVLAAMKEGYIKANLDTKVLDHYINGASLDISGKEEKDAMTKAKIALLRKRNGLKPMSFTQLHKAAASGNLDEVKRIVGEGMIDINDFQNDAWETPLVVAIKHKHWPIVEYLVEQGADVNIGGAMADAPACLDMSPELLKLMFERSITVNNDLLRKMLLCTIE
ncbi:MAG: NACHT domain-containing protein, partial [Alphaproteobacteria bacterium]